jgi:hypothetical protein
MIGGIWGFVILNYIRTPTISLLIAAFFGAMALGPITLFPVQVAYDSNWYTCVVDKYPLQGLAFTAYTFVPVSTIVATLGFMATLLNRKMISELTIASTFFILITGITSALILAMEWHLSDISNQSLYIPCGEQSEAKLSLGSVDNTKAINSWFVDVLDVTAYTRSVIHAAGYEVPTSPYSFYTPPK